MLSRWIYKIVRRKMDPIDFDDAAKWKKRLALAYGFIAWNAFGYICYTYYQGRGDKAKQYDLLTPEEMETPQSVQFARLLGIKKAHVVQIKGLTKVNEFDYDAAKDPAVPKDE